MRDIPAQGTWFTDEAGRGEPAGGGQGAGRLAPGADGPVLGGGRGGHRAGHGGGHRILRCGGDRLRAGLSPGQRTPPTPIDTGAEKETENDYLWTLNFGPQHPATHGVLRVILRLDGEKVLGLECVIGYLHRGVEKIAENRTYTMFNPYVDRMDYVAAVSNGLGYC